MVIKHNVDHTRQELIDILPRYEMIEDCLQGEYAVKEQKTIYLPCFLRLKIMQTEKVWTLSN
mgnify:CR=1 FL=1